jgi:hypothetical protein
MKGQQHDFVMPLLACFTRAVEDARSRIESDWVSGQVYSNTSYM